MVAPELIVQYNLLNNLYKNKKIEISVYDKDGNHLMTNANSESCANCLDSTNCPKKAFNLLHNPIAPEGYFDELKRNGIATVEKDIVYTQKNGHKKVRSLKLTTSTALSAGNQLIGYLLIVEEITDIKEIQRNFETAHKNLLLSLSLGKITAWKYDIANDETTLLSVSQDTMSNTKHIYKAEDSLSYLHEEDREKVLSLLNQLIEGKVDNGEISVRFKLPHHQDYVWYRGLFSSLKDADGKTYAIIGNQQDMTDILRQTQELKDAKEKLILNNEQLSDTFKLSRIVPFVWNVRTNIFRVSEHLNNNTYSCLSNNPDGLLIDDMMKNLLPKDIGKVRKLNDDIASGKKEDGWLKIHYDASRRFNKTQLLVLKRRDKSENVSGYLQDITEYEQLTNQLVAYKKRTEEADRLKSVLLSNISHELRTPLNQIIGFSQILTGTEDKKEQSEYLSIIQESSDNLVRMVDNLVTMSDLNSLRNKRERKQFNLSDTFADIFTHYKDKIWSTTDKSIEFKLNEMPSSFMVKLDEIRTLECLDNLLSNAFKYTKEGHIHLGYTVDKKTRDITMYVEDTGIGVSEEDRKRIFGDFEKGDSFVPGIGLGLSICMRYVNDVGCSIGVDSKIGVGSTFWIKIPHAKYKLSSK